MAAARTRSRFDREPDSRPQNDAYVGLLALSLLAMIASCILLWIDYSQYGSAKPPAPSIPAPPGPREPAPQSAPVGALPPGDNSLPVAAAPLPAPVPVPATPDIQPVSATLPPAPVPAPEPTGPKLDDPPPLPHGGFKLPPE